MTARVVHKYPIDGTDLAVTLPLSAQVAHFAEQHGQLTVWIDRPEGDAHPTGRREYAIRGTGDPTPDGATWRHCGSTLVAGGTYVFHLYERNT